MHKWVSVVSAVICIGNVPVLGRELEADESVPLKI
jgi:hypothetical protein